VIITRLPLIAALLLAVFVATGCGSSSPAKPPVRTASPQGAMTGEASWYGKQYQGRPTASGEPYDRRKLTAAHPSLPFGTKVKVTDLETGRSVVVTINDRFGGHRGRIIDLSEAAFERIAPLAKGVTRVRLEVQR